MIISVTQSYPNDRYLPTFKCCGDGLNSYLCCVNIYLKSSCLLFLTLKAQYRDSCTIMPEQQVIVILSIVFTSLQRPYQIQHQMLTCDASMPAVLVVTMVTQAMTIRQLGLRDHNADRIYQNLLQTQI